MATLMFGDTSLVPVEATLVEELWYQIEQF
jgi:hypothetical protein